MDAVPVTAAGVTGELSQRLVLLAGSAALRIQQVATNRDGRGGCVWGSLGRPPFVERGHSLPGNDGLPAMSPITGQFCVAWL